MRTTISLPDELAQTARKEARKRGVSLSAVIRESLEIRLCKPVSAGLPWQGIVSDAQSAARRLDAALSENWSVHIAGDR